MADYMVVTLREGNHQAITYYRKYQKRPPDTKSFVIAAKAAYVATGAAANQIEVGDVRTGQPEPTADNTEEI